MTQLEPAIRNDLTELIAANFKAAEVNDLGRLIFRCFDSNEAAGRSTNISLSARRSAGILVEQCEQGGVIDSLIKLVVELVRLHSNLVGQILRTPGTLKEEADAHAKALDLLEFVGLKRTDADITAKNLPYGLQRRLEIARALGTEPKLLLLDEPTAGMNPNETADLTDFILKLRKELGLTILLIEHHMRVVMGISDRVSVLDYGEKIAEGSPAIVQKNKRVIEAYLGKGTVTK